MPLVASDHLAVPLMRMCQGHPFLRRRPSHRLPHHPAPTSHPTLISPYHHRNILTSSHTAAWGYTTCRRSWILQPCHLGHLDLNHTTSHHQHISIMPLSRPQTIKSALRTSLMTLFFQPFHLSTGTPRCSPRRQPLAHCQTLSKHFNQNSPHYTPNTANVSLSSHPCLHPSKDPRSQNENTTKLHQQTALTPLTQGSNTPCPNNSSR